METNLHESKDGAYHGLTSRDVPNATSAIRAKIKSGIRVHSCSFVVLLLLPIAASAASSETPDSQRIELPDPEITAAYEAAATQNVLAAVNPAIFPGYWSVCADGIGHGHGNTYPALDGHQMADALLYLGQVETVKLNWNYVKSFQRPDGQLPFAILPAAAGKPIGPPEGGISVDPNGGLYTHWVPDNPLRALGYTTYVQNADVLFRKTGDLAWLKENLPSVNLAADYLAGMTTAEGAVGGAGYYVERPTRVEYDGVTQGHAVDAFRRLADLNEIAGDAETAKRFRLLANRIESNFQTKFWVGDHFAEYIHPQHGAISNHGLTDTDWTAIAMHVATDLQQAKLWPQLQHEMKFRYAGVPTGIATMPETYEAWEFSHNDRMDLAAMGRVWYIECQARANMGDAEGLADAIRAVCKVGRENGYFWRERYNAEGGFGVEKYCEYPANLIRVVQRFVMGVEYGAKGELTLAPNVPAEYWEKGFGQTLAWRGRELEYRFQGNTLRGSYIGLKSLVLRIHAQGPAVAGSPSMETQGLDANVESKDGWMIVTFSKTSDDRPGDFILTWSGQ